MKARDWDRKWQERLTEPRLEPSRFLLAEASGLAPGRALDLACGAGRNAVWLAERGFEVTGVDFSAVALAEARRLAAARGVEVAWVQADVVEWEPQAEAFDLVFVLYLQLPPAERRLAHEHAAAAVARGGTLLVVAHHRQNLTDGYGGPRHADVLFTEDDVAGELPGLVVERAERVERPVATDEGDRVAIDVLVRAHRPSA